MPVPQKQIFMQVKQKLDQYRLPTSFPYEATTIIHKLIQKIEEKEALPTDRTRESYNGKSVPMSPRNCSINEVINDANQNKKVVSQALQWQIKKLLHENHHISRDLSQARQYIQILKECKELKAKCDSITSNRSLNSANHNSQHQINMLRNGFQILKARQLELFEELTQVKYKYNELMDLLHEDPHTQKQYIKRLLKHKKLSLTSQVQHHQEKNQTFTQRYFKSQTVYGINPDPQKHLTNQINTLQTQNYKLTCLNRTLKQKLENKEIEILKLQNRLIDDFNLEGLVNVYQLNKKDNQIIALKNQVQMLLDKLNHSNRDDGSKQKTVEKIQQTVNNSQKITNTKSPLNHINIVKSPPKFPEKTLIKIVDQKNRQQSKERKDSMKSPEVKTDTEFLIRQNSRLKHQIQQLKRKMNDQVQNNKSSSQRFKSLSPLTKQHTGTRKGKTIEEYEKEIKELKKQITDKGETVKKIEMKSKNLQEENRTLNQKLREMSMNTDEVLNKNKQTEEKSNRETTSIQSTSHNRMVANNNSKNHLPPMSPKHNRTYQSPNNNNHQKNNQNPSFSKQPFGKKPSTHKSPNNSENIKNDVLTTNIKSTQECTFPKDNPPRTTVYCYSPSEYAKSDKRSSSNKVFSEKMSTELKSEQNDSLHYPSNIHSKISSEQQSKDQQKVRLPDIQEQESLQKSHYSQQQLKSRPQDNYYSRNPYNNPPGIKVSSKQNYQYIENQQPRVFLNYQEEPQTHESRTQFSEIQMKNYYSHFPYEQEHNINTKNSNMNLLQIDQSDKGSVFHLRKEIYQLKIQNRKQIQTKNKLQKKLQSVYNQKDKLQDRVLLLQQKLSQFESQNYGKQQKYKSSSGLIKNTINESSQTDSKIIKIKQQHQRIAQMQEQKIQAALRIRQKDSLINYLEKKIYSLSNQVVELTASLKHTNENNLQLKKKTQKLLMQPNQEPKQEGDNFKTVKREQSNQSSNNQYDTNRQSSILQGTNQISWLKKQIKTLETKIQTHNQTVHQLNTYIKLHVQEKEKLSLEKLNFQKQNDYLKQKLMELQRALAIQAEEMKRYRQTFQF